MNIFKVDQNEYELRAGAGTACTHVSCTVAMDKDLPKRRLQQTE